MTARLPGGIRVKLALTLLAVVGGALLGAYLMVIPSLERRLVKARLDQVERDALPIAAALVNGPFLSLVERDRFLGRASDLYDVRIVLFQVIGPPVTLTVISDSAVTGGETIGKDGTALSAARESSIARARVTRAKREFAEVAVPVFDDGIVLFAASLETQLSTVSLIERRMLYASVVGLAIAFVLGSAAAAWHARRIRRLERAANSIAAGVFSEPVHDRGTDELGQLARAFDSMRSELAQVDNARKEFVANASHELRTPLFSLGGFLELLADEELDDATRRGFLTTTREQVERLTSLATDLLDLSRIDVGRLRLEKEDVDMGELARVLGEELQPVAGATGHALEVSVAGDVWASADEERVLQIARALGRNAIVHTPVGSSITVRTRSSGRRALLEVEDDGPGVPSEHLGRIFQRFYRVDGPRASGSGLGLAIARELAAHMGGTLDVESRPGRTVFRLELPAAPVAVAVQAAAS